ncbi:multiple cyclophane-containing RiPP AmcA [Streptomyces sp. FH025]|uniref:multiple cyclophane-containing RiPP AmcA n=1 Tax=Streptomyces sp. FH025 TaxID=2815937 RepID=UPI001A9DBAA3|nr:multiple cyclophane-containing RiPP AmcA [Streptomyces sp. FH025]MBO1416713.1 hypothetical protein [Streptomyces sp. FH025]
MTVLEKLATADTPAVTELIARANVPDLEWNNSPTWSNNPGSPWDNAPSWDNWSSAPWDNWNNGPSWSDWSNR